mmetsp:Transcript_10043/g.18107  ORF Transcript_10043/g.18107 Transcript_10043/m.18107 type:complete len:360 (-) Transcript_10043:324-1403(-)
MGILRIATLPFTLLFIVSHIALSIVLIDGILTFVTLFMTLFQLHFHLRQLQTFILKVWMSPLIGYLELFGGLTLDIRGDQFIPNESCLLICNHRSWVDTIIIYSISRQVSSHGALKFLAKKPLLLFPIYGFAGYILHVVLFITRSANRAVIELKHAFESLKTDRIPFWMISYLEGTRRTPEKLQQAQEFARERDLPVLRHVLQPRVKGFVNMVTELRSVTPAVYDITIGYEDSKDGSGEPLPSFTSLLLDYCGGKSRVVKVLQRRIPMENVPENENDAKMFVYNLYKEKDELLDDFEKTGEFKGNRIKWTRMSKKYFFICYLTLLTIFFILVFILSIAFNQLSAFTSTKWNNSNHYTNQ